MIFGLLASALSAAPPTTIMAVGDSITYGCGYHAKNPNFALECSAGDSSYRGKLYELLTASGHAVQMVGRVASGDPSDAGFPAAQHGHEGYPGERIDQLDGILFGAKPWAAAAPDVMLVQLGTNDIWHENATVSTMRSRMHSFLNHTFSRMPTTRVLLASIPNMAGKVNLSDHDPVGTKHCPGHDGNPLGHSCCWGCRQYWPPMVGGLNAMLKGTTAAYKAAGRPIEFVDLFTESQVCSATASPEPDDCCHSYHVHPTKVGYEKMAAVWAEHIGLARPAASAAAIIAAPPPPPMFKPPPLGFSSWNKFGMGITVPVLLEVADAFASSGLQAAGYLYLCTDDGWMNLNRSATTGLQVPTESYTNGTAFPTLRSVADALHARAFKFGIYTAAGSTTCGVRAGSLYNERLDAEHYARSGVDYIKYDGCGEANLQHFLKDSAAYDAVVAAYSNTERGAIDYFSYHPWKTYAPEAIHEMPWVNTVGHLWRTTEDIRPDFEAIMANAHGNDRWAVHQKPGHYADADMLEIGNGGLTLAEQRTHFALWCLMKSPLLIGADPRALSKESLAILTNSFLIAVNQDALGVQGTLVRSSAAAGPGDGVAAQRLDDPAAAAAAAAAARGAGAGDASATAAPVNGSTFITACTFGDPVAPEQHWRISADGRLQNTQHGHRCLVRGSGDSRALVDSAGCASLLSKWDFGRANKDTLSQVRQLRHYFGTISYVVLRSTPPTRTGFDAFLGESACWMLIGACDPM